MIIYFLIPLLFGIGALTGLYLPTMTASINWLDSWVLAILLLSVGMQLGLERESLRELRQHSFTTITLVIGVIVGSLLGGALFALLVPTIELRPALLAASGLGFYSVSSQLIEQAGLSDIATLTLIVNILRELIALSCAAILVKFFGTYAGIAAAASASDSGAPVLVRAAGSVVAVPCLTTAFVLSLIVPLLVQSLLFIL